MIGDHLKLLKDQKDLAQTLMEKLPEDHAMRARYAQRIAELNEQISMLDKGIA